VVPAHYYEKVGQSGFLQKPIGAGPYRLVSLEPGVKLELEAFTDYYRPVHIKQFTMVSVPEAATRVAMLERGEADLAYFIPGELIDRVKNNPKLRLAPVVSGNWWLQFPGFQNPSNPFHDKRVRQSIATRSMTPSAAAWAWSTATGSTTTSNMACRGRSGRAISPRRNS
jgi:peptide/nickel transport system substrate-binding protein